MVCGRNLNSSKLSCMSSLPARMKMTISKVKELECSQDFSRDFSSRSRAANSAVLGLNFELIQALINVCHRYLQV